MNEIVKTLFYALQSDAENPFDTEEMQKVFYNAYNEWIDMAEIEEDEPSKSAVFDALAKLERCEREQAFQVGMQTAFKLLMNL